MNASEKTLCREFAKYYQNLDYRVVLEKRCKLGRADLVATRKDQTIIIETKLGCSNRIIAGAIGQLICYAACFKTPQLIVATPEPVTPEMRSILVSLNIEHLTPADIGSNFKLPTKSKAKEPTIAERLAEIPEQPRQPDLSDLELQQFIKAQQDSYDNWYREIKDTLNLG